MACTWVKDGRENLQIWMVAANMFNKQSQTADKGWSSSFVVWRGAKNPHRKNVVALCYKLS